MNEILNVIIGLAIYNFIIKSIALSILKLVLNTDAGKEEAKKVKESFVEKIEKLNN
jgi:hypothetical protein